MTEPTSDFTFVDDPSAFREEATLVVRIPAKAHGKQKLLNILAEKLHFPHYFGHNWDALHECLGDLSWLSNSKTGDVPRVAIVHEGLPFSPAGDHLAIYLAVLRDAVATRNAADAGPMLTIVFSTRVQNSVLGIDAAS